MPTLEKPAVDEVEHHDHHIVVRDHGGYPVVEVSIGSGVLAAVVAPLVAAAGTVAALANDWSVEIE
jgi:predicted methyltransferase